MTKYMEEIDKIILIAKDRDIDDEKHYEEHHIIPRSLGGTDDKDNLILLELQEHYMVHKLLFMHYNEINDIKATESMAQAYWLMSTRSNLSLEEYEEVRIVQKNIAAGIMSKTMKGKMPARDKEGNKYHVDVNDPRVISGEIFHHSKGREMTKEERLNCARPAEQNGRYSGLSDEYLVDILYNISMELNEIPSFSDLLKICEKRNIKFITSLSKFRFNGKGKGGLHTTVEEKLNMKYNGYKRGDRLKEYKNKIKRLLND